nr:immunoglobulin heavy chain junction region [Macaca mulatta]MOW75224.1 immunoglobulin heavy chain junction region [Macaca mulatta]MOW75286.1 immunoglobulin heavy chain junction region [Macaca mulatta]MOW75465.1 immunoglobulin heavy chain junction region [Macaca mulatta]MOW75477.1 immunoglobulin heavy chain junction region [Macaca mulatta]
CARRYIGYLTGYFDYW